MGRTKYTRKDVLFCLDWCVKKYGNTRGIPKIILRKSLYGDVEIELDGDFAAYGSHPFLGFYYPDDHSIEISIKHNPTLKELCKSVIHEYIHSIQPITGKDELSVNPDLYYENMEKLGDLEPVEMQAEFISMRDFESLRKELLQWRQSKKKRY